MNPSRRAALKTTGAFASLVSLGLITQGEAQAAVDRSAFDVKTLADALKAIGGTPATSDQITVVSDDIVESGSMVPVAVISKLPNTSEIYLIVEKNLNPLSAAFMMPPGTIANVQTRLKLSQSSLVVAVVKADGKLFSATRDIRVTIGGCGG